MFRLFVVSFLLLCWVGSAQAACRWGDKDLFKQTRNFTYEGKGISLPLNAADGEVYNSSFTSYYKNIVVDCKSLTASGMKVNTAVSNQPAAGEEFSFKSSNYYWTYRIAGYPHMQSINAPGVNYQHGSDTNYGFGNTFQLRIYKKGDVNDSFTIPAGLLGTWVTTDGFEIAKITLLSPIAISAASCSSPNVNVNMGEHGNGEFEAGHGKLIGFDIKLLNCPKSITRVEYLLKANTEIVDGARGIVSLNNSSTASGVGLQVKDAWGKPLALDVYRSFNRDVGGDFNIPLSASYIRLSKNVKAGTANTGLTYIIRYL
ncbi:fimbrial protein [Pseudomonas koreensis]|uniref:fimbrial protein n=1 Tax=Pseudomonas koreensis TaxID=198620 RepID=UPI00147523DA|nr:fimbrial protein [Pseudomonas koreensis]NNA55957.1 type 1 fimbrial protein [Pseudomonas koreensis]